MAVKNGSSSLTCGVPERVKSLGFNIAKETKVPSHSDASQLEGAVV
jgi:hypothetical protein